MTLLATALTAAAAWVVLAGAGPQTARLPGRRAVGRQPRSELSATAACALAALGVAVVAGLPLGIPVGLAVGFAGPPLLRRLEPAAARRERQQLARDVPLCLDLLSACLAGGASLSAAATAVAAALPGPCGRRLASVHAALVVGAPPEEAWLQLGGAQADDPLRPAARLLARAAQDGAPTATAAARLSAEARAVSVAAGAAAARRVGVLVVAPLGLCFLPAFVLLGIVPVVAGLAGPMLRGL
jgi:pilus assembly protein TadC